MLFAADKGNTRTAPGDRGHFRLQVCPGAAITGKMQRAFELQAAGQSIEVLSGQDFLAMLD